MLPRRTSLDPMRLHEVDSHRDDAATMYGQAGNTSASMTKASSTTTEGPGKTAGGAIQAGVGMGVAGASAASSGMLGGAAAGTAAGGAAGVGAMAAVPYIGWAAAAVGIAAYMLS